MEALWTDWRKTALGACALGLLVIMFTHEGGVADSAVTGAQDLAASRQEEIRAGAEEHKAWFAADESTYEVNAAPPPPPRAADLAAAPVPASPETMHHAEPKGEDFPVGLKRPG